MSKATLARLLAAAEWMAVHRIERLDREPHHLAIKRLKAAWEQA